MFKSKVLAAVLIMGLVLPLPAFAFRPALVPGLPAGVHFEMTTEENGLSILATVHCVNTTTSSLYIKTTGGIVSVVNPNIHPNIYPASAYAEFKIPEGAYDVPAHSKVVIAHHVLPMKSVLTRMGSDGLVQPVAVMSTNSWIVRAEFDIMPNHYASPTMQMKAVNADLMEVMVTPEPEPLENPDDIVCLGYPVCYENMPMHIVVEDTVQMDYRWRQLDVILSNVKNVGSNVASTQATISTLSSKLSVAAKTEVKPTISRPAR